MPFGKRQSGVGASAQALNVDMAVPQSQAVPEAAPTTGYLIRSFLFAVACCAGLFAMFTNYGPNIVRDLRLAGTWQPAYDLRAVEGKCERTNFIITFCNSKIKSVAAPDQAPITVSFMMLFSGGGGEALVPVRSTKDRAAVSIFYAADAKLLNRTLSFIAVVVILMLMAFVSLLLFWRGANNG